MSPAAELRGEGIRTQRIFERGNDVVRLLLKLSFATKNVFSLFVPHALPNCVGRMALTLE